MKFAFLDDYRGGLSKAHACQVMGVTDRGLRAWKHRPISHRQRRDLVLLAHIRDQHRLSQGSYGRPRMTEELNELGLRVGHRRVGRLMRQNAICVVRTRKFKVEEGQEMIRGIISPTRDGQRPHIQYRAESLAAGFRCEPAQPEMGWRHHLCLDAGRLGLSGGHSRSAFAPSDWLGHQQPDEEGSSDPCPEHGHPLPGSGCLHPREGPCVGHLRAAFITRIAPLTVCKQTVAGQRAANTVPMTIKRS